MNMHYCNIFDNCAQCPAPYCPHEKLDEMIDLPFAEVDDEDEVIGALYDEDDRG